MIVRRTGLIAAAALLLIAVSGVAADGDAAPADGAAPELTAEAIGRMRIKELRHALWERGVECVGCTQKEDLAARLTEARAQPVVRTGTEAERTASTERARARDPPPLSQEELDRHVEEVLGKADLSHAKHEKYRPQTKPNAKPNAGGSKGKAKTKAPPTPDPKAAASKHKSYDAFWAAKAREACGKGDGKGDAFADLCGKFAAQIRLSLQTLTANMAKAMGKSAARVFDTSKSQPYLAAGERALKKAWASISALQTQADAVVSGDAVKEKVQQTVTQWWLNTILENPQNMFAGDDMDIEAILRSMGAGKNAKNGYGPAPGAGAGGKPYAVPLNGKRKAKAEPTAAAADDEVEDLDAAPKHSEL